jgi:ATP-dependent DNA helicase DinG
VASGELLGPAGPFAQAMPGYEARAGQLVMAEAVERALAEERVLLCEAGTGTGKTIAYLVPAILSGRKVVVSTATRALQDQIFFKDLPLIERALGRPVHAALMKGLSNYLCRRRYQELRRGVEASRPHVSAALSVVERWAEDTESGDVSELAALGEDDPILSLITSSSDTRVGASCQYHAECFVTRMKREADAARLVVVNHHLFFADLALRGAHPGRVIPDYDAVIFDEAHQLEDVATTFFGVRVSEARVTRLLREMEHALGALSKDGPLFGGAIVPAAQGANSAFFRRIADDAKAADGRAALERDFWTGERQTAMHALDDALDGVRALADTVRGELVSKGAVLGPGRRDALALADGLENTARRAEELRRDLATIVDGAAGRVTWVDTSGRSPALSSSPIDLSSLFRSRVFEAIPATILTSATLSSGKNGDAGSKAFAFIRSRLGLDGVGIEVQEEIVLSPFDYASRALLYLPRDLPPPADPTFLDRAADRVAELVEITGGGAFVLTTSLRSMHALHRGLRHRLRGRRLIVQGEAPKTTVLSRFRSAGDAVLVATASFWQGVDVPGDALRLVVLEKIPFPVPSDPVILARAQALEAEGKKPFIDLHIPLAKIALKQGFGRLIRSRTDRGIVALLDDRVNRRGYGKDLLLALPPALRATDLEEVRAFWGRVGSTEPVVGATSVP